MNSTTGSAYVDSKGASLRPDLVGIPWVAKRLGVTPRHVRRLIAERRIPFVKWGHLVRFDPAEIELWLNDARRPAQVEAQSHRPI
jgi:excisionase family DNA binding protein